MILVTLGTQDKTFVRLLDEIDKLINKGIIQDKVIVQAGFTKYSSDNMEIFDLIPQDEFNNLMSKADLVITHGGVGNIISALEKNKKVCFCSSFLREYDILNMTEKTVKFVISTGFSAYMEEGS